MLLTSLNVYENEIEGVEIIEYPTIPFYPSKLRVSPIIFKFNENITVDSLIEFLKESHSFIIRQSETESNTYL